MRPAPDEPTFTPGIAIGAWVVAVLLSNLVALVILGALGYESEDDYPIWLTAVLTVPLWIALTASAVIVSRRWGTASLRRDYGLAFRPIDVLGVPIGVLTQLVFVPALYWLLPFIDTEEVEETAERLTDSASGAGIALLVVLVVVGAPIVEELFFRGLVLRAFQARLRDGIALLLTAAFFAVAHLLQWVQMPALFLFGVVAGYLAQRTRRLGMSIFAHAGFNATTVVVLLAR